MRATNDRLEIGQTAADFALKMDDGSTWRLSDHVGTVIALLFYPQNETLVCNRQLCMVRDKWQEYLTSGATLVGISPAPENGHAPFREKYELPFPLLDDPGRAVTADYCGHWLFPLSWMRGVIIIDAQGVVRSRETMLRAFRPKDATVLSSIYAAKFDRASDEFAELVAKRGERADK